MKDVRQYIRDFHPPLERLETLLQRVQQDAYAEGVRDAADQLFAIAEESVCRVDRKMDEALRKS